MKKLPSKCPSCGANLIITELACEKCKTIVRGEFPLNRFLLLSPQEENFLLVFLISRGNLKEVQERLNISYPTAKSRLEEVIKSLGLSEEEKKEKEEREKGKIEKIEDILKKIESGDLTGEEALKLIEEEENE
ncbi:MAG: DUF2089 domain-containing protein [Caldisericia bacterium]|jgi:hypothetical protein|nr:DUF2089 domain-containing protein [Caldisericia bacterium]